MLRMLDAPITVKDYVKNDPKCNYEFYMVELLNNSTEMRKCHQQEFVWQGDQTHAECDAYSGDYGIDFKLIASQSSMKASSNLSHQYTLLYEGVILGHDCKANRLNREKEMTTTILHAAMHQLSLENLEQIRHGNVTEQYKKDVRVFLEKLETKKNLLLFYPYEFSFENKQHPKDGIDILINLLQKCFMSAFCYRSKVLPGYETYLTTLYYNDFVLVKIVENQLELMNVVKGKDCPTFEHLKEYSEIW